MIENRQREREQIDPTDDPETEFKFELGRPHGLILALVTRHRSLVTLLDNLSVFFLAQGEQSADSAMERLATFLRGATRALDFAVYDMRFSDPLKAALSSALHDRAE